MRTGCPLHACGKTLLPMGLVVWALAGGVVQAQRLLTLGPELKPSPPGVPVAVPSASSAGSQPHAVQVDMDLVRSAPARLELPTPGDRVLVTELTVFEDRDGGDVMWSGRFPGAEHDSVVVTIADNRLVALVAEPLGASYQVAAGADGSGRMVEMGVVHGPDHAPDTWCGFDAGPDHRLHDHRRAAPVIGRAKDNSSPRVASPQSDDELKILILYTSWADRYWNDPYQPPDGVGASVMLRSAADYLRMVFRNGDLGLTPKFAFAKAPDWLNRVPLDAVAPADNDVVLRFFNSAEIELLRRRHGADLVHLFHTEWVNYIRWDGVTFTGSLAAFTGGGNARTFAHETGHQLGGKHEPGKYSLERAREEVEAGTAEAWQLYAFAHSWHEDGRPAEDGSRGDHGTAISVATTEPYYSTVRIRPGGQQMGIAGERENERAFKETVFDRARQSVRDKEVPLPPTDLWPEVTDSGSVVLHWTDNASNEGSLYVSLGADDEEAVLPFRGLWLGPNHERFEVGELRPGSYWFRVTAYSHSGKSSGATSRRFVIPGAEPSPPGRVSAGEGEGRILSDSCTRLVVSWHHRFTVEELDDTPAVVEVQLLGDGEILQRRYFPVDKRTLDRFVCGLEKRYEFRLYSHSSGGRSPPVVVLARAPDPPPVPERLKAKLVAPSGVETGERVLFDGSMSVGAESYRFDFGNGDVIEHVNGESRVHYTYLWPAVFSVRLEVGIGCTPAGCEETDVTGMPIGVRRGKPPAADFDLSTECRDGLCFARTGEQVTFRDTSTGTVATRIWSLGDGSYKHDSRSFQYGWPEPGYYPVRLEVQGLGTSVSKTLPVLVEASEPKGTCEADPETLCLRDSRYEVKATWLSSDDQEGAARVAYVGTNDSGLLWFFQPENYEMLVKVLDGCAINGRVWVYGSSATDRGYRLTVKDTVTGRTQEYRNEPGQRAPAIVDADAFPEGCSESTSVSASSSGLAGSEFGGLGAAVPGSSVQRLAEGVVVSPSGDLSSCPSADVACFHEARFEASVLRHDEAGEGRYSSPSVKQAETKDSGVFYFFDASNWEVLVKLLDGCALTGSYWLFAASATDLGFDVLLSDTETGESRVFRKPPGRAPALVDTAVFQASCQP